MNKKLIDYEGFEAYAKGVKDKYAERKDMPTTLAQLKGDSSHRLVTDAEKYKWNNLKTAQYDIDNEFEGNNGEEFRYVLSNYDFVKVGFDRREKDRLEAETGVSDYLYIKGLGKFGIPSTSKEMFDNNTVPNNSFSPNKALISTESLHDYNKVIQSQFEKVKTNIPEVDLSGYVKKSELDSKIDKSNITNEIEGNSTDKVVSQKAISDIFNGFSETFNNCSQALNGKADKEDIPTKLSQLTNDNNFKTEAEIQSMIEKASSLKKEVVTSLPKTGKDDVIYLVKDEKGKDNNNYLEYLWLNGKYELIGSTQVDLSGYIKKSEIFDNKSFNGDPAKLSNIPFSAKQGVFLWDRLERLAPNGELDLSRMVTQISIPDREPHGDNELTGMLLSGALDELFLRTTKLNEKKANRTELKTKLSEMTDDSTHRLVTDTEKETWNNKLDKTKDKASSTDVASGKGYGKYVDANLLYEVTTNIFAKVIEWLMKNQTDEEFTQQELEEAFK